MISQISIRVLVFFARKYLPFVALAIVSNVSSSRSAEGFVVRPAKDPNKLGNELRNIMQKVRSMKLTTSCRRNINEK